MKYFYTTNLFRVKIVLQFWLDNSIYIVMEKICSWYRRTFIIYLCQIIICSKHYNYKESNRRFLILFDIIWILNLFSRYCMQLKVWIKKIFLVRMLTYKLERLNVAEVVNYACSKLFLHLDLTFCVYIYWYIEKE